MIKNNSRNYSFHEFWFSIKILKSIIETIFYLFFLSEKTFWAFGNIRADHENKSSLQF